MVIQWYGQSCFKITSGDITIAIDPFSKTIGLTPPRFKADILLVSHSHHDHANIETIPAAPSASGRASPNEVGREGAFIIRGPGDYEIKGVSIRGIETFHDRARGKERGLNTAYLIETENIRILHLGDFGEKEIRAETAEEIGNVDILLIPVGGTYTIDGEEAPRVIKQIEPKFVVPMHYKIPGLTIKLEGVETFLKEMGATKAAAQEKLVIKKKDVEEEGKTEVVVLKPA